MGWFWVNLGVYDFVYGGRSKTFLFGQKNLEQPRVCFQIGYSMVQDLTLAWLIMRSCSAWFDGFIRSTYSIREMSMSQTKQRDMFTTEVYTLVHVAYIIHPLEELEGGCTRLIYHSLSTSIHWPKVGLPDWKMFIPPVLFPFLFWESASL